MRQEIRDSGLAEARRRVQQLTTYALPEDQRAIAVSLVRSLVVPNSFHDADATQAYREEARSAVEPVEWTIREGESILREGELVSDHALEKLEVLGMLERETDWQHVVGAMLLMLLLVAIVVLCVLVTEPLLPARPRREALLALMLAVIGVSARMAVPGHTLLPYLFPTAAAVMLVTILLDLKLAILVSAISAVMVSFNAGGSIELTLYALLGGLVGGLTIWRMDQLGTFIRVAAYVALTNVAVVVGFRLYRQLGDAVGLVELMVAGVANAIISSSLTFVAFAVIGRLFGIATSLQLLELARPTHPLFRRLLIDAPGSYHHSILVSNMAERACEIIGADALLARVGSYYHDVGKLSRPYFFAENQTDGQNPHKQLDPPTSADIIIGHVSEGLALARRYRLPDRVSAFIPEHHGTTLVTYFYRQASQNGDGNDVREEDYRYPGPKPQSRETAVVMLADGTEATVRATRPGNRVELERVVRQIINDRLISGQLDECDLTLRDLDGIREAFVSVLQGVFHPRIQYPEKTVRRNGRPAREAGS
jgi:putative nucleotidyltransferase with HDIG domain